MRIDPPDSRPTQSAACHQFKHFVVIGNECLWQLQKKSKDLRSAIQVAKRELSDDERVNQCVASLQKRNKLRVLTTQMIDPD